MTEEMLRASLGHGEIFGADLWNLKIWEGMYEVLDFLTKPFQILFSIPLGEGDMSVMHFIIGVGIIGIAIFFFWRSSSEEVTSYASSTMRRDRAERESFNPRTTKTSWRDSKGKEHSRITTRRRLR